MVIALKYRLSQKKNPKNQQEKKIKVPEKEISKWRQEEEYWKEYLKIIESRFQVNKLIKVRWNQEIRA